MASDSDVTKPPEGAATDSVAGQTVSQTVSQTADKPAGRGRRKVGRPEGSNNLADEILNAAEHAFAENGYAGTTLRQVAETLGVNAAMVAYYFQNKENLFRQVFLRRGTKIAAARMENLAALRAGGSFGVDAVVRAFILPSAMLFADPQGRSFLKLHARIHMEPIDISFELRRIVYDTSTRAYADVLTALLPQLDREAIYQRLSLLIGSYLYAYSGMSRLDELLPDGRDEAGEKMLDTLIRFGTAGMCAD